MNNQTTSYSESIILIDSSTQFNIKKFIEKKTNFKIISFDYESHIKLQKNKIAHEISDNYLNESERENLQEKAYHLSNWAQEAQIKDFLDYNNFNLGKLFYYDIFIYLIPFLKKFNELQKISKEFTSANFFSSGQLYQMMKLINNSIHKLNGNEKTAELHYDYIELQNNFLKIKIPSSYYFKFKNLIELGIHYFFGPKKRQISNGALFVEFNTEQYDQLFLNSNLSDEQVFFYSRKRPAIWNLKSFSIIKKSKCFVITTHDLINKKMKKSISSDLIIIKENANLLFQQNNFFESFFSLNNISFWKIIKPFFVELCLRRFNESIIELQLVSSLLKKFKPKCVIVLSESGYTEQFIIHEAKHLGIPVILYQHGLSSFDSPKSNVYNTFSGSVLALSDMFVLWGNAMEKYSKQLGIIDEKIRVLGSSSHDKTFEIAKNSKIKTDFILLSSGLTTDYHINDYTIKANEEYINTLKMICKTVKKANKKLVIKMHPHLDDKHERYIVKEIDPSIKIIRKGNMLSLVQSCELLITIHITSAILDAQILNKPVLRIPLAEWWGPANCYRPNPGLEVSIDKFEEIFNRIMKDKNFYKITLQDGRKFVNDCLVNPGTASKKIIAFIKNAY